MVMIISKLSTLDFYSQSQPWFFAGLYDFRSNSLDKRLKAVIMANSTTSAHQFGRIFFLFIELVGDLTTILLITLFSRAVVTCGLSIFVLLV